MMVLGLFKLVGFFSGVMVTLILVGLVARSRGLERGRRPEQGELRDEDLRDERDRLRRETLTLRAELEEQKQRNRELADRAGKGLSR